MPQLQRARAGRPAPRGARLKILLVDGTPLDRAFVRYVLSTLARLESIRVAGDGREALDYLLGASPAPPSLILTETDLPELSGFDLIAAVRNNARLRSIPIVVLSSRCDQMYVDRAYSLGANAYICKARDNFGVVLEDLVRFWLGRARLPAAVPAET